MHFLKTRIPSLFFPEMSTQKPILVLAMEHHSFGMEGLPQERAREVTVLF